MGSGGLDGLVKSFRILHEATYHDLAASELESSKFAWPVVFDFHSYSMRARGGDEKTLEQLFKQNGIKYEVFEIPDPIEKGLSVETVLLRFTRQEHRPGTVLFKVDGEDLINNLLLKASSPILPSEDYNIRMKVAATMHKISSSLADPSNNSITFRTEAEAKLMEWVYNQLSKDGRSAPHDAGGALIHVFPSREGNTVSIDTDPKPAEFAADTVAPLLQLQRALEIKVASIGTGQAK